MGVDFIAISAQSAQDKKEEHPNPYGWVGTRRVFVYGHTVTTKLRYTILVLVDAVHTCLDLELLASLSPSVTSLGFFKNPHSEKTFLVHLLLQPVLCKDCKGWFTTNDVFTPSPKHVALHYPIVEGFLKK